MRGCAYVKRRTSTPDHDNSRLFPTMATYELAKFARRSRTQSTSRRRRANPERADPPAHHQCGAISRQLAAQSEHARTQNSIPSSPAQLFAHASQTSAQRRKPGRGIENRWSSDRPRFGKASRSQSSDERGRRPRACRRPRHNAASACRGRTRGSVGINRCSVAWLRMARGDSWPLLLSTDNWIGRCVQVTSAY